MSDTLPFLHLPDSTRYTVFSAQFPEILFFRISSSPPGSNFVTIAGTFPASTSGTQGFSCFCHKSALAAGGYLGCSPWLAWSVPPLPYLLWTRKIVRTVPGFFLAGNAVLACLQVCLFCAVLVLCINFAWPHVTHLKISSKSPENITFLPDVGPKLSTQVYLCMWHLL